MMGGQELMDYHLTAINWACNPFFSLFIIIVLTLVVYKGERFMFKVMNPMSFILVGLLLALSLFLIPHWKLEVFFHVPSPLFFVGHFF